MADTSFVQQRLMDLMDKILFYDKKRIVSVGRVTLHPSEVHILLRCLAGMSFSGVAESLSVSKSAISQTIARLRSKGIILVAKDGARKNAATVTLTALGHRSLKEIAFLQSQIGDALAACLKRYSRSEHATLVRFMRDVDELVLGPMLRTAVPQNPPHSRRGERHGRKVRSSASHRLLDRGDSRRSDDPADALSPAWGQDARRA